MKNTPWVMDHQSGYFLFHYLCQGCFCIWLLPLLAQPGATFAGGKQRLTHTSVTYADCNPVPISPEMQLGWEKLLHCFSIVTEALGIKDRTGLWPQYSCRSDHVPFAAKGYLAVHLLGDVDEEVYHTCADSVERIHFDYAFAVTEMAIAVVLALAELEQDFVFYPLN